VPLRIYELFVRLRPRPKSAEFYPDVSDTYLSGIANFGQIEEWRLVRRLRGLAFSRLRKTHEAHRRKIHFDGNERGPTVCGREISGQRNCPFDGLASALRKRL